MVINMTRCEECIHKQICKNKNQPNIFKEKVESSMYGKGPNDDYDIGIMSEHYDINIQIRCKNYGSEKTVFVEGEKIFTA